MVVMEVLVAEKVVKMDRVHLEKEEKEGALVEKNHMVMIERHIMETEAMVITAKAGGVDPPVLDRNDTALIDCF
jgi:hypothetical protein